MLSATDATAIVDTLLARIRDVFPCGMVSVTLGVPDGAKSLTSVVHDYGRRGRRHIARVGPPGGRRAGPARRARSAGAAQR